jgi:hypothetical protein
LTVEVWLDALPAASQAFARGVACEVESWSNYRAFNE